MFSNARAILSTALADLRYQSWQVLAWRCTVKLLSPLLELEGQILYDLDLKVPVKVLQAKLPCTIDLASEADIDGILAMQFTTLTPAEQAALGDRDQLRYARLARTRLALHQEYARRLRLGEQCFVARVDGAIAHSNWTRPYGRGTEENCQVVLEPGQVYLTDGHTVDHLRGQGLHLAVHTQMLHAAQQAGCHLAYTITDMTKAVSRRALKRVGWRRRGAVIYLKPRGLGRRILLKLGREVGPMFMRSIEG